MRHWLVLVSVVCFLIAPIAGAPVSSAVEESPQTHTLIISSTNESGSVSYVVTTSGNLTVKSAEPDDYAPREYRLAGTVGSKHDSRDVVHYTGFIESFESQNDKIQIRLDGTQIEPDVLSGQHIQITRQNNSSPPTRYQLATTGKVSQGELADQNDTATKGQIRGNVSDRADSFYFTGNIMNDSLSLTGSAHVTINGQNASVFVSNPPPTPPPTTSVSTSTPPSTIAPTSTPVPIDSPTESTSPAKSQTTASSPEQSSPLKSVMVGFVGGIIIVGVALFVFFRV